MSVTFNIYLTPEFFWWYNTVIRIRVMQPIRTLIMDLCIPIVYDCLNFH